MSSAARVSLPPGPAKAPRKRAKPQKRKSGPTVSELILKAASASPERGSVSLAALKKALKAGGYDVVTNKARILTAIKRLVASKSLVRTKGTGAAGSFRLNKKPPTPRKTALKKKKKKKPKAKRVKRTSPRKTAGDDATPAAKKSPKKRSKSKSPAKSPKSAKRRTAKSTRTRAAAAKK